MVKVEIYTQDNCAYCSAAKSLLASKGVTFTEINLQEKPQEMADLKARTGMRTVPQIFINGKLIGGFSELQKLDQDGKLDPLLES